MGTGMHRYRFLGTPRGLGAPGAQWVLDEEETQHLVKTLRLTVGATVEVTDGQGTWSAGVVQSIEKRQVSIDPVAPSYREKLPLTQIHLLLGALKPGAVDEILPGLTELGLNEITVFLQEGAPAWTVNDQAVLRWNRILRQSIKQCKRAYLPTLNVASSLGNLLALKQDSFKDSLGYVLSEHSSEPLLKAALGDRARNSQMVYLVCGSEKGLTDRENALMEKSALRPVSLGSGILRAKTAALVATGILAAVYVDGT
jgi:16S rRNA (uracil1498-N3)-methyltransferase